MNETISNHNEIINRRFGRNHKLPCLRPEVLTCALWECQKAGHCQADQKKPLGTGTVITEFGTEIEP